MIKRMTKATSLLVAAAAIISIVPAHAADYTKIDSQEGTIYDAVAYKDGKFYVDGEVNDKDEAAYYLADGKYNNLSDIDSGADTDIYGSKYLEVQDGDYFVDLDNGSVTDESIKENAEDDAASALRKNLKKDNDKRYASTEAETIQDLAGAEIAGNKFSAPWYKFEYTKDNATNGSVAKLNVYTDAQGNYIDADYNLGSIKVTTTASSTTSKTVTIANTDDSYDADGTSTATGKEKVSASVDASTGKVIGQDANYIYRTAKVTVNAANGATITKINGMDVTVDGGHTFTVSNGTLGSSASTVEFNVVQKISKAQASGNIDGAKYAKSVTTYIVSDEDGKNEAFAYNNYTVANGKIVGYTANGTNVKTATATLSSKNGYYYVDLGDEASEDVKENGTKSAVDTDVDGNLWRLDAGYIYKWDNDEDWTKVYKVDGSFDQMSVYNQDNIVAWSKEDDVYSVIGGKGTTPTDPTTPVVNKGWVKTDAGWTFYNTDGTQVKGQWVNDGGVWYYIKADGVMATGWIKDGSTWYFLQSSGAMKTGWLNDNGTWYYLQSSGAMATGWLNDNGTWYFLNSSGAMLANTTVDGYKLGASGAWIK
ncbi:N-acetylmuramoyl-L-alanine amidase family protein [Clostridium beijerinckii]|uniref:Glucan-binding YG repeat protein n=1 Tax=Clostridium beijerinckii TaxID=1520 RepID=A0AAX0B8B1_CLOBE|nr:N-acetylmuramoyl-L-alanine amidase family protein [Clostridium beijerinckii]MBA8932562.1 glucan-binding YG repeat protein [Clostridium beijerinckii]NRT37477.1 glucan-binding YG repeat protein [Clostridium beijerinckii]NRT48781.1 glucan-binding YG repeat protein [Clostridium beijerinckii]NRT90828.1 glucan-binding YG repeat protein [Clostridium beijerinckii]NRU36766.1 glucan-binding YG repeat protein [Clostridium beijerinckii]